ncbi:universal stress protein [Pseudomonas putida]|uniref:universal stress protein n=1 Tax=Pseudomonas putida TaxID=303 RepID=UPI0018D7FB62|nr:universal stress protein [Pseudomonas putida]MBH3410075.1 universal stress protein [Pseudomonas putida]
MQISKLLVIVGDEDRYDPAIEQAVELALAIGASVTLAIQPAPAAQARHTDNLSRQKSLAKGFLDRGIHVEPEVRRIKPSAKALVKLARACDADLVILQAQVNGDVSFDLELMRLAPCPVLFARERAAPGQAKLFVAAPASCEDLDDGVANAEVVETARLISHARKAKMHLFSVYDQAALLRHSEHYSLAEIPSYETLASACKRFAAQLGVPNVHHHLIVGSCAHTLCAYANRCGYDTVVITSPHRAWQFATLEYLLASLTCSLLVVHAKARQQQLAIPRSQASRDPLVLSL